MENDLIQTEKSDPAFDFSPCFQLSSFAWRDHNRSKCQKMWPIHQRN